MWRMSWDWASKITTTSWWWGQNTCSADLYRRNVCSECEEQSQEALQETKTCNTRKQTLQRMQSQNVGRGYFRITQRYHQEAITSSSSSALHNFHFTFYGCSFRRVFLSPSSLRPSSELLRLSIISVLTNECRMQWMHENLLISDSLNEITVERQKYISFSCYRIEDAHKFDLNTYTFNPFNITYTIP